jgi:hypothetical protein
MNTNTTFLTRPFEKTSNHILNSGASSVDTCAIGKNNLEITHIGENPSTDASQ